MTVPSAYRGQFVADSVATASPARLLTMLYDRLVLDLVRAEQAYAAGQDQEGTAQLVHAQDILVELRCSLDVDRWSGGPGLASLYSYLLTQLIEMSASHDVDGVARVRGMVEDLRDAWRHAALLAETGPDGAPPRALAAVSP